MEPDQWGDGGGKAAQRLADPHKIRKRSAVPMGGSVDDNGSSFNVAAPCVVIGSLLCLLIVLLRLPASHIAGKHSGHSEKRQRRVDPPPWLVNCLI